MKAYPSHPVLQVVGQVVLDGRGVSGTNLASFVLLEKSAVQRNSSGDLESSNLWCVVCGVLWCCCEYDVCTNEVGLARPALRVRTVKSAQEDVERVGAIAAEFVACNVRDVFSTLWRCVLNGRITLREARLWLRCVEVEESFRKKAIVAARVATIELVDCCLHFGHACVVGQFGIGVPEDCG